MFGSSPRQTVKLLCAGVAVARGRDVSEGAAVAVALDCTEGNLQAMMVMEKTKPKESKVINLLNSFMEPSFFEENIFQLYKQAALVGGLFT